MGVQRISLAPEFGDEGGGDTTVTRRISILLPTDTAATIRPVLDRLSRQSLPDHVEIVVVIPHAEAGLLNHEGVTIAPVNSIYPLCLARAAGVRVAAGEYVFIGETHSFPRAGMFERILAAHEGGATVVVPSFENENPGGLVSWAGFLNGYASWTCWRKTGELVSAPLFNVSYRRSFLLDLGELLGSVLLTGEDMSRRVSAVNGKVIFEPGARIGHVNITRARDWLPQRVLAGRSIASVRSAHWGVGRRYAYAVASPLIPLVLMSRHWRGITGTRHENRVSQSVLPVLALGMFFQAWGEMLGYLLGESADAVRRYDEYEVRQLEYGEM
jgi:hypothetical protein